MTNDMPFRDERGLLITDLLVSEVADINEAFGVIHALRRRFGMVGTEFCRVDLEDFWNELHEMAALSTPFTDEHWEIAQGLKSWNSATGEWMTEKGWEFITEAVIEDINAAIEGDN